MRFFIARSVMKPAPRMRHGVPTSEGRDAGSRAASSWARSRASTLVGLTGRPLTLPITIRLDPSPVSTVVRPISYRLDSCDSRGTARGSRSREASSSRTAWIATTRRGSRAAAPPAGAATDGAGATGAAGASGAAGPAPGAGAGAGAGAPEYIAFRCGRGSSMFVTL